VNGPKYVYRIWYEKIVEETIDIVAENLHEAEAQIRGRKGRVLHTKELHRYEEPDGPSDQPGY